MAILLPQTGTGNPLTYAAATAGGDTIAFGVIIKPLILIRNASAASITVTLTAIQNCNQGFLHPVVYTCPIGDTEIVPPANVIANSGNVVLAYSAVASVTVAAVD